MATGIKTQKLNSKLGCYTSKGEKKVTLDLAWEIPWIAEPGGLQSVGSESDRVID